MEVNEIVRYIEELVNIPSPTGFTAGITDYLEENARQKSIRFRRTKKGAVVYSFHGKKAKRTLAFAAHVDALGAMVKEVREDTLTLVPIGSTPPIYTIGDYCTVHCFNGKEYEGTILPDNPAAHNHRNFSDLHVTYDNISVRPDIIPGEGETLHDYFQTGNFVSLNPRFTTVNGFVKARHLDDKASAAVLLYLADLLREKEMEDKEIHFYFNITEETGQGISALPELDELIIVDMGVVGEGCRGSEFDVSLCAKDSSGPYNYELTRKLASCAEKEGIGYCTDIFPFYSSDGSSYLRAGHDAKTALIGPGIGASHGYERTHETALEGTARLIYSYIYQA